jgi:Domain of unknown function (DUF1707)
MSPDPTTDPTLRIGDADREHAAAALGRHLSVGRLVITSGRTASSPRWTGAIRTT